MIAKACVGASACTLRRMVPDRAMQSGKGTIDQRVQATPKHVKGIILVAILQVVVLVSCVGVQLRLCFLLLLVLCLWWCKQWVETRISEVVSVTSNRLEYLEELLHVFFSNVLDLICVPFS